MVDIVIDTLQRDSYDLYLMSWKAEHEEGEPVCFDEFCGCEFCDDETMRILLPDEIYGVWRNSI